MYKIYNHKLLVLVAAMICTFTMNAQFQVTLEADGTTFGPYDAVLAAFGEQLDPDPCSSTDGFMGAGEVFVDITNSSLACDSTTADLTDKVAVIDRGACFFTDKVRNAQNAGAIGVVVITNDGEPPIVMGGDDTEGIVIPAVMVSRADGEELKTNIAGGTISVGVATDFAEFDTRDVVIWGDNGEGGFDGGLNGWTTQNYVECAADTIEGFSLWQWRAEGGGNRGAFVGSNGNVNSPTVCNGVISFDSDFYDNDGISGNFGAGPCAASQAGSISSPAIDLSGVEAAGLAVTFYQALRQFQSTYWVGWSTDGGITWDSTQINQEYEVNSPHIQDIERVNLPSSVIGASDFRLRFTLSPANYYYWTIDDVRIVEREANNLRVSNSFFALPPNAVTPQSQVEAFGFLADIENIGAVAQDEVNLNMTIVNEAGDVVFASDLDYGTVGSDSLAENVPFAETFTPSEIGLYQGTYTVSSNNDDFDETDNQQSFFFFISDTTFAKEYALEGGNDLGGIEVDFDQNPTWAYGQSYYVPNGAGYQVTSVTLSASSTNFAGESVVGLTIIAAIYKWDDVNEDGTAQGDERELLGFREYEIQEGDNATTPITLMFNDVEGEEILLEDDTEYLVMNIANGPISLGASTGTFDYNATIFLTANNGAPRYGGFIGLSNDLAQEDFGFVNPTQQFVPFVRLNVNTTPVNVEETLTAENEVKVYPNPATTELTLSLDLQEVSKDVRLRVFDMTGKLISVARLENISNQEFTFNTSSLQSGVYVMEITTDFGVRTVQFEIAQ
ncbi:MAG: PA domain-containing protein [Bacteroidota bacterium]